MTHFEPNHREGGDDRSALRLRAVSARRMGLTWARVSKAIAVFFLARAIVIGLYVLSAPPIIKADMEARVRSLVKAAT